MDIVIDIGQLSSNPLSGAIWLFTSLGWLVVGVFLIAAGIKFWQFYIRNQYRKTRKYIVLAIDVPRNNEQTPKAVENIFNHLSGAHKPLNKHDKWWFGSLPESISLEIVSLGGYIQFLIHLEKQHRDLVEAMIYAQYPEAEITEVEDYTKDWKITFPNDKYELWGTEITLAKSQYYPIRTYEEFEDKVSKEAYKDSMAAMLEALTRIGPGEQIWVQFVITPADNDWGEGGQSAIKKIIGEKPKPANDIVSLISNWSGYLVDSIVSAPAAAEKTKKDDQPNKIMYLTQGGKDVVTAIEKKTSKVGFHTRIRTIYLAEKASFKKSIGGTLFGSFKQFNTLNLNAFKPDRLYYTGGFIYFKQRRLNRRKNRILSLYKSRGHFLQPGDYGKILNSEELATIYHFPTLIVKTPLLQKTQLKKAEPPLSLPVDTEQLLSTNSPGQSETTPKTTPPPNLPV